MTWPWCWDTDYINFPGTLNLQFEEFCDAVLLDLLAWVQYSHWVFSLSVFQFFSFICSNVWHFHSKLPQIINLFLRGTSCAIFLCLVRVFFCGFLVLFSLGVGGGGGMCFLVWFNLGVFLCFVPSCLFFFLSNNYVAKMILISISFTKPDSSWLLSVFNFTSTLSDL